MGVLLTRDVLFTSVCESSGEERLWEDKLSEQHTREGGEHFQLLDCRATARIETCSPSDAGITMGFLTKMPMNPLSALIQQTP